MLQALSFELDLAVACSIWPRSEYRDERLSDCLSREIDWGTFSRVLARHRIEGLANEALRSFQARVPATMLDQLQGVARNQALQSMRQIAEAQKIQSALSAAGIACAFLKGLPLAQIAYGNTCIRHSKDIDIVVQPDQVSVTAHLLEGMGYIRTRPPANFTDAQILKWKQIVKHFEYIHAVDRSQVELHWRFTDNPYLTALMLDPSNIQHVQIGNSKLTLPTLSEKSLLMYLCAHGASHGWSRLKWVADIVALLQSYPSQERQLLADDASSLGTSQALWQVVEIIRRLYGIDFFPGYISDRGSRLLSWVGCTSIRCGNGYQELHDTYFHTSLVSASQILLRKDDKYARAQFAGVLVIQDELSDAVWIVQVWKRIKFWISKRLRQRQ
jgi:hypothetical protein